MRHDRLPRPALATAPAPAVDARRSKRLTLLVVAGTGLMLALGYGGFLLLGGRLADRLGRRRVFLILILPPRPRMPIHPPTQPPKEQS